MKQLRALVLVAGLACIAAGAAVYAQTDTGRSVGDIPPAGPQGVSRPARGMSMDQVRQRFGDPLQTFPPVGDPPITRWVYDRFTVYFEHQYAIHSVVHRD